MYVGDRNPEAAGRHLAYLFKEEEKVEVVEEVGEVVEVEKGE
jgi:hypothetical protein